MKPFLGVDLTQNKKNDQINGEEFIIQKPSPALAQSLESALGRSGDMIEKSKLPLILRIIQYLCYFAAIVTVLGILRSDVPISEGYKNAPYIYWAAVICGVIAAVLALLGKIKANRVFGKEESQHTVSNLEGVADAIYTEMKIPEQARDVDVLSFFYKVKGDQIKTCEKGVQIAQYLNPELKVYADAKNLYLADLNQKYAIPQASILGIRTVNKHIRIESWNKSTPMNKGIYKQYKLTEDKYGCVHCKCYHIIEVDHNGQRFGIYIPCYELPVFEALTGKKAQPI